VALRVISSAVRRPAKLASYVGQRGYAVATNTIRLSLVLPHQALYNSTEVLSVQLPAQTGDMGILAHHEPTLEALRPGVVEVKEASGASKKWFISGGFATVHPDNALTVNAVEGAPLEDFSLEAARSRLTEVAKVLSGSGSDKDKMEARLEKEVYEAVVSALK